MNITAIVLAAGESSRMGTPKSLMLLNSETFLGHILSELRASRVDDIVIVLGYRPEVVLEAMPEVAPMVVVNEQYPLGQLSSFKVGLRALDERADSVLMCLVDHPLISSAVANELIGAHERTGNPIVVPTYNGRRGHPTLFARAIIPELLAAPLDEGARVVVRAHAAELLEVPTSDPGVVADIDTPAQYAEWMAYWKEAPRS